MKKAVLILVFMIVGISAKAQSGAKIEFKESEAIINLNLGFLLKPFKGKILDTIEKQIKKVV